MKKILYITFKSPYPDNYGYPIRAFNIAKALTKNYEVDLLYLTDYKLGARDKQVLKSTFHKVIPFSFMKTRFIMNGLFGVISPRPLQVEYFYNHRVREWVKEHYRSYDLIFCSTVRTTEYVKGLKVKKALDLIDDLSLSYGEFYPIAPFHWKLPYFTDWARIKRYHRDILPQFKKVFIASQFDADHLNFSFDEPLKNVSVIPNGVREHLLLSEHLSHEENSLMLFGTMSYLPNRDGALYFLKEIFPAIRALHPDVTLHIVGKNPSRRLERFEGPHVAIHGYVEDPYPLIQKSKLVVTPIRAGAGVPNKILESMALKKANVISPVAARGIEGADGVHYVVARNKGEWVDSISRLLGDEAERKRLGQEAHRLIQTTYRWDIIQEQLLKEIDALLT